MCLYRQLGLPVPPAPPYPPPSPSVISPAHGNRGTPNPKWRNSSITSTFLQTREEGLGLEVMEWKKMCHFYCIDQKFFFVRPITACSCVEILQWTYSIFIFRRGSQTEEPCPCPAFRPSLFPNPEATTGLPSAANPPEPTTTTTTTTTATATATATTTTSACGCAQVRW